MRYLPILPIFASKLSLSQVLLEAAGGRKSIPRFGLLDFLLRRRFVQLLGDIVLNLLLLHESLLLVSQVKFGILASFFEGVDLTHCRLKQRQIVVVVLDDAQELVSGLLLLESLLSILFVLAILLFGRLL